MANTKKNESVEKIKDKKVPKAVEKMIHDEDDIVTLMAANGEEVDFVEIAGIAYRGNFYAILQPVQLLDGMAEDEALVFKVSAGKDGEDNFDIELDDAIIEAVFKEYEKLYNDATGADGKK